MFATLEFLAGLALALATLHDVFDTVVVPGPARGPLKISHRVVRATLPLHKRLRHDGRVGVGFGPTVLTCAFIAWMLLLMLAFGLMAHALSDSFRPALDGFGHALFVAGSAMSTISIGDTQAFGLARGLAVAAGFCSLAVLTLAVTYLLEVQSNTAQRDAGVLKIVVTAGAPPSALALLERYAALGADDEIPHILREGREWCATVLQSHASHPSLVYFRSVGTSSGWPAALGALIDLSLILERLVDREDWRGGAVLLREQAERLAKDVAEMLGLQPASTPTSKQELEALCLRVQRAGYRLRPQIDLDAVVEARLHHTLWVTELARHLGTPGTPLLPGDSRYP